MESQIVVELKRSPLPKEGFQPLSLPARPTISLEGSLQLFKTAFLELQVQLREGRHKLPLSDGPKAILEIAAESQLKLRLRFGAPPHSRTSTPVITQLDGEFSEGIWFQNILATLTEVQRSFRDHQLQALTRGALKHLHSLNSRVGLKKLLEKQLPNLRQLLSGSRELLDAWSGGIKLQSFSARPRWIEGRWQLRFSFSGEIILSERISLPFRELTLPRSILPSLHADPLCSLKEGPLASAELLITQITQLNLSRALLGILGEFKGYLRASGRVPALHLRANTFHRGRWETEAEPPQELTLKGSFSGGHEGDHLRFEGEGLQLAVGQGRLRVDLQGEGLREELLDLIGGFDGGFRFSSQPLTHTSLSLKLRLREGSTLENIRAWTRLSHPLALGEDELSSLLKDLRLSGEVALALDLARQTLHLETLDLEFAGEGCLERVQLSEGFDLERQSLSFQGHLRREGSNHLLEFSGQGGGKLGAEFPLPLLPELGLETGRLQVTAEVQTQFEAQFKISPESDSCFLFDAQGSSGQLQLSQVQARLDGRRWSLAKGGKLNLHFREGQLSTSGLGRMELDLDWELDRALLHFEAPELRLELELGALRRGALRVQISPEGGLRLLEPLGGLKEGELLKALLKPQQELERWVGLLENQTRLAPLWQMLSSFSAPLSKWLRLGVEAALRFKQILDEEKIEVSGDIIPRERMAQVFSRVLSDDLQLKPRLAELIQGVTEAQGLNWRMVEQIIDEIFPQHNLRYELDRVLRWLDRVLSPMSPLAPLKRQESLPLLERPEYQGLKERFPSAGEIYAAFGREGPLPRQLSQRLASLAPYLHLEMLEALLKMNAGRLAEGDEERLRYVRAIKQRLRGIHEGYGGFGFAPQAIAISFFLSDLLEGPRDPELGGLLGPADVAILLQAGLASWRHDRSVQINQRMLMDYLQLQPKEFFVGVFAELSLNSPRVLTGVLMAFLDQDQVHIKAPLDLVKLLSEGLETSIPRQEEYLAGGRWARESYYKALMGTAEYILQRSEPYQAMIQHLNIHRHPTSAALITEQALSLEVLARRAIQTAEEISERCDFERGEGPMEEAKAAWQTAFETCAVLLREAPQAFQRGWFRKFWALNHEALVIRSVVHNYQEGVDRVRPWLHIWSGRDHFEGEQALLEAVIRCLYYDLEDQQRLLNTPLVRLLLEPPPGAYDFSIVSAMGVITDGAQGAELEDAFRRLAEIHEVKLIRADTATAETLEYNAERIEEAIRQVEGAYGLVGYSQGCANILMAESRLRGGTPEQQRLLEGLRCRNFLFSAFNGSAHGSCGNLKLLRAMVDGEIFLKHYQAVFSQSVIKSAHKVIFALLDSRPLLRILGSMDSISHEGILPLHRDGQFLSHVPSSSVRGVVNEQILPEALEWLYHVFQKQVMDAPNDTQIILEHSHGHSILLKHESLNALERCDLGSLPQNAHHWSPLLKGVDFVCTSRDRERAVYDSPKDRHLFPWVEVNARFGIIRQRKDSEDLEQL